MLLATTFFCSLRYRVGDSLLVLLVKLSYQFQALVDSKMVLLPLIRSIPIASAVRCYTEIQSLTLTAVFPSFLSGDLVSLLLSLCYGEFRKSILDTTYSVDLRDLSLIDCTIERFDRILCRWAIRLPSYSVCCMELQPID